MLGVSPAFDAHVMLAMAPAGIIAAAGDRDGNEMIIGPAPMATLLPRLADLLSDWLARGMHVLVGVDAPLGVAQGGQAELDVTDWRGWWRRVHAGGHTTFPATGARLSEGRRPCERPPDATALLALAEELRRHAWLAEATRVWPFETGLRTPAKGADWRVLIAELCPALIDPALAGADPALVVRRLSRLDHDNALSGLFAADPALSASERAAIEAEEGWALGAMAARRIDIRGWIKDPAEIYRQSFATIRTEIDLSALPTELHDLTIRVVHACGMTDVAQALRAAPGAAAAGRAALAAGAPILVDAEMVSHGIIRRNLPRANPVICTLNDPAVPATAKALGTTRSAMAVDLWLPHLDGAVVAIGNAPTALFRLLELIADGAPRPAVILGFAVGFVGAAESKEALAQSALPFITLPGRRGGSAMAAAAVNALAGGLA